MIGVLQKGDGWPLQQQQKQPKTMHKTHLLVTPNSKIWWCSQSTGPSFFRRKSNDQIEAFITGRDADGISRIGTATINKIQNGSLVLEQISNKVVFDIGESGCFDENGVSYPWIVEHNSKEFMFYVGWVKGGKNRFQNFLGLAIRNKEEEFFTRISKSPIMDRSNEEPYGIGSCCVVRESGRWLMLYTSFLPWNQDKYKSLSHPHSQPSYNIKYAYSDNLIDWQRSNESILDFQDKEHIHGKPVASQESNGEWNLYFSVRGDSYRIAFACGSDLMFLKRGANLVFQNSDWISMTQEYAFPLTIDGWQYLFFNGNGYGRSGLGYAVLNKGASL